MTSSAQQRYYGRPPLMSIPTTSNPTKCVTSTSTHKKAEGKSLESPTTATSSERFENFRRFVLSGIVESKKTGKGNYVQEEYKSNPLVYTKEAKPRAETLAEVEAEMKRLGLDDNDAKVKELMSKCEDIEYIVKDQMNTRKVLKVEMGVLERNGRTKYERYATYAEQLVELDEEIEKLKAKYHKTYDEMEMCYYAGVNRCLIPMMVKDIEKIKKVQDEFEKFRKVIAGHDRRARVLYEQILSNYMDEDEHKKSSSPWYDGRDKKYFQF